MSNRVQIDLARLMEELLIRVGSRVSMNTLCGLVDCWLACKPPATRQIIEIDLDEVLVREQAQANKNQV